MEIIQKCNDTDLDNELKRADGLNKMAIPIASLVKSQMAMYLHTGTLPENNIIFADGEKIVTGGLVTGAKPKRKGLLMDEFNR